MTGTVSAYFSKLARLVLAAGLAMAVLLPPTSVTVSAAGGDRTIWLHHTHTGDTAKFTFKRNGQFDQGVLRQMNVFLADWRTKEPTKMDPALFDLLWEIYQEVGGTQPINIVSSYRSPKTNAMLRAKSSAVAEHSQHMLGKAMDVFIPGVNLSKLRATAMRHQVGGVGFYPTSGSPFVHVDTGSVRAWPRMTRAQLLKVFPDGKTLHLPTDGKPISSSGRAYAEAQWSKCHMVPCRGPATFNDNTPRVMLASVEQDAPVPALRSDERTLIAAAEPTQRVVPTFEVTAPIPLSRPGKGDEVQVVAAVATEPSALGAPVPSTKSARIRLATRSPLDQNTGETAVAALAALEKPAPLFEGAAPSSPDEMVTAYVPTKPEPGAELALKMLIERSDAHVTKPIPLPDHVQTASIGPIGGHELKGMFDMTFDALSSSAASPPIALALADLALSRQPNPSISRREAIEFVAPEIDHVNDTLVEPVPLTASFWAELTEAEGYVEKGTELGPLTGRVGFIPDGAAIPAYDRFVSASPLLVAGL